MKEYGPGTVPVEACICLVICCMPQVEEKDAVRVNVPVKPLFVSVTLGPLATKVTWLVLTDQVTFDAAGLNVYVDELLHKTLEPVT